ncbi:MAG: immunity 17 family protein [Synergistaceae bacterium]|jgi:purine-cytosine permease-like protein|nr:immunity 17 family protein [Synergistaceae bacterium]
MDWQNFLVSLVVIFAGVFSTWCAFQDYDWFMNSRKARFMVWVFGRKSARVFYIVLGVALMLAGFCHLIYQAARSF